MTFGHWSYILHLFSLCMEFFFFFFCRFVISDESRLATELLDRYAQYNKHMKRPLTNSSASLKIKFGIFLIQILDFHEKDQLLTTLVWKAYVSYGILVL